MALPTMFLMGTGPNVRLSLASCHSTNKKEYQRAEDYGHNQIIKSQLAIITQQTSHGNNTIIPQDTSPPPTQTTQKKKINKQM